MRDYVSRYEWNIYRYPTQYIRLKQMNWKKMKQSWENPPQAFEEKSDEYKRTTRFLNWLPFRKKNILDKHYKVEKQTEKPQTELELKHFFLDQLLTFQFKWATSTVADVSFVDPSIYDDENLRYFLQRFPDTYLLLYYPVFHLKQAPVDGEIILISPLDIEIIYLIDADDTNSIKTREGRVWDVESSNKGMFTMLNPEIPLKRTETIIRRVLSEHSLDIPVKRTVLSRKVPIITDHYLYQTTVVGSQEQDDWFNKKRELVSPLKNRQLKAAGLLLNHCMTTAVKRAEWVSNAPNFQMDQDG